MSDTADPDETPPPKRSKRPLLFGLVLAVILAAGGFYAVWSGLILADHAETEPTEELALAPLPDVAFVPIQPIIINLGESRDNQYLRFQAQLEVRKSAEQEITELIPRIVDVLNGYLRAIKPSELEKRTALIRMRAQMLRRIQVVTGEGRVRDLLIMEFVLN
ncbi:MAG: flagellar basal body-associated FliL family protein [Marinosulfonomonas sp.]